MGNSLSRPPELFRREGAKGNVREAVFLGASYNKLYNLVRTVHIITTTHLLLLLLLY